MIRMGALALRIGLRHIRPSLGLAIKVRAIAVVDVARRIYPNQPWTTASRLRHRSSFGRRRRLRSRRRLGHRSSRGGSSSRSSRNRCRSSLHSNRSSGSSRSRGRIPLLHALVSASRALLARRRRIGSILTDPCGPGRRRRLSDCNLHHQKSCRNRHRTNQCLHKHSGNLGFLLKSEPEYRQILRYPVQRVIKKLPLELKFPFA
jgi:hypothetical protein